MTDLRERIAGAVASVEVYDPDDIVDAVMVEVQRDLDALQGKVSYLRAHRDGAGVPDRWIADVAVRAYLAAAGRAGLPDQRLVDLVVEHLRERWPCTCRPGMDGGGVYHEADCKSRAEGSRAVVAVIELLRAASSRDTPTPEDTDE